jgi:hypothetical protein
MSDPFKEFVEEMARLAVPEDDTEESRGRREAAASESGTPISELDESDLVACADDEFLCSEALALWAMISRRARWSGKLDHPSAFMPSVQAIASQSSSANVKATRSDRRSLMLRRSRSTTRVRTRPNARSSCRRARSLLSD